MRRPKTTAATAPSPRVGGERLQKVLAAAGIASRRQCEELILAGRVEVDRRTVTELGTRVDPARQEIRVDGVPLPKVKHVYYVVHKPSGVVSTHRDPQRRPRVIDLVPSERHLFPVGRLDAGSEGLIVVTSDGELANRLTHPRYGVEKTYLVQVAGIPDRGDLARLKRGEHLAEGFVQPVQVQVKNRHKQSTNLVIVLAEGRNREIRRLLARIGHKVMQLRRIAIGPLRLGTLAPGQYRTLTNDELKALRTAAVTSSGDTSSGKSSGKSSGAGQGKKRPSHRRAQSRDGDKKGTVSRGGHRSAPRKGHR